MAKNLTPLESMEQELFVRWLEQNQLKFTAIPNSTYTRSWSQKYKNHATGLRAGLPDLLIVVQPEQAIDGIGKVLFVEMKRQKGSAVSKEQQEWIDALNSVGSVSIEAVVCKGADEAMKYMGTKLERWHYIGYTTDSF